MYNTSCLLRDLAWYFSLPIFAIQKILFSLFSQRKTSTLFTRHDWNLKFISPHTKWRLFSKFYEPLHQPFPTHPPLHPSIPTTPPLTTLPRLHPNLPTPHPTPHLHSRTLSTPLLTTWNLLFGITRQNVIERFLAIFLRGENKLSHLLNELHPTATQMICLAQHRHQFFIYSHSNYQQFLFLLANHWL